MARSGATHQDWEPVVATEVMGLADFSAGALSHVVSGAEFEHRRLPGGAPNMQLLECRLPHSVINQGSYSPAVLVNGVFAPNAITFGAILDQTEPAILNGSKLRTGTVQFYAEKAEVCFRTWPNGKWLTIVISRERLLQFCLDHLDQLPSLPSSGFLSFEPVSKGGGDQFTDRLRDLARSIPALGTLRHSARVAESIEHGFLTEIANLTTVNPLVRKANRPRRPRLCHEILRGTIELLEDDPTELLDLQSMSKVTGLSPRTLQRTFQAEYGLCPQEWLRVERLNRVRQDLLRNSNSVTHAATRWGFFHLGRFSQYYRQLFGERPSSTLGRRMASQACVCSAPAELQLRRPAA